MSRRVLITGASGFAGSHLAEACRAGGDELTEISRAAGVDLLDAGSVQAAVAHAAPEVVFHLAALASVPASWANPQAPLVENTVGTLNLLEAVRAKAPEARVVLAGSGEVYGPPESLPVREDAPLRPQNPYAVSKAGADLLAGMYADAHGLEIVRARAFNHAGPRQTEDYVVATLTRQVAAGLEAGDDPIRVVTGDPDPRRDFTDVRDVVRAYRLLAGGAPAGVYNVCSGVATSVAELLAMLAGVAGREIDHHVDPARVRGHDVMEVRGSAERLTQATGWRREIPLERTLADTVAWWREQLSRG